VLSWTRNFVFLFAVILATLLAVNALSYSNFDPHYGFLKLKQTAIATGWYLPFYYAHVLIGGIILMIGLFQLLPSSHSKFRKWHRRLGYVYVVGILFLAAPGGFVMSLFINRGPLVLASFVLQSLLWFYFTLMAFIEIRRRSFVSHRNYMWRSYALTFAAITLRIYIFFSSWGYDLSQPAAYATLAWLSWLPNLLIAEYFITRAKSTPVRA
jgi:hypothetical protein